jgi:hypothetical protein
MENGLNRLDSGTGTEIEDKHRYQQGTQIFQPAEAERMIPVFIPAGENGEQKGDQGCGHIQKGIEAVHHDRMGMDEAARDDLGYRQYQVHPDADQTAPDDFPVPALCLLVHSATPAISFFPGYETATPYYIT